MRNLLKNRNPYFVNAIRIGAKFSAVGSITYFIVLVFSVIKGNGPLGSLILYMTKSGLLFSAFSTVLSVFIVALISFIIGVIISPIYTKIKIGIILKKQASQKA